MRPSENVGPVHRNLPRDTPTQHGHSHPIHYAGHTRRSCGSVERSSSSVTGGIELLAVGAPRRACVRGTTRDRPRSRAPVWVYGRQQACDGGRPTSREMGADVAPWEGTAPTAYTWIWRATAAEASRPAGPRPVPAAVRGRAGLRTPAPGLQALYVQLLRGANEESDELSQLFDTVVRLHTASRLSARPPATGPTPGDAWAGIPARSNRPAGPWTCCCAASAAATTSPERSGPDRRNIITVQCGARCPTTNGGDFRDAPPRTTLQVEDHCS